MIPNPYPESEDEFSAVLAGMEEYFCIQARSSEILAKTAKGGEFYGYERYSARACRGDKLCLNPLNGYRWVMKCLDQFYCLKGRKTPETKPKLQQDGFRKGKSKHTSVSNELSTDGFCLE